MAAKSTTKATLLLAALAAVPLAMVPTTFQAQQVSKPRPGALGQWRLLGHTEANHSADHDVIVVVGPYDSFRSIKFKVTDAPLNLLRLVVTYGNGEPDKLDVRQNIPQGGESRVIDLHGAGKRVLRRIDFWYETKGFLKGKADVTVFGMK